MITPMTYSSRTGRSIPMFVNLFTRCISTVQEEEIVRISLETAGQVSGHDRTG